MSKNEQNLPNIGFGVFDQDGKPIQREPQRKFKPKNETEVEAKTPLFPDIVQKVEVNPVTIDRDVKPVEIKIRKGEEKSIPVFVKFPGKENDDAPSIPFMAVMTDEKRADGKSAFNFLKLLSPHPSGKEDPRYLTNHRGAWDTNQETVDGKMGVRIVKTTRNLVFVFPERDAGTTNKLGIQYSSQLTRVPHYIQFLPKDTHLLMDQGGKKEEVEALLFISEGDGKNEEIVTVYPLKVAE